LRKLLDARDKLRDLLTKVDRSDELEGLLERVLKETEGLEKLKAELGEAGDKPSSGGEG
jgi:type VI secretion system protein ImpB